MIALELAQTKTNNLSCLASFSTVHSRGPNSELENTDARYHEQDQTHQPVHVFPSLVTANKILVHNYLFFSTFYISRQAAPATPKTSSAAIHFSSKRASQKRPDEPVSSHLTNFLRHQQQAHRLTHLFLYGPYAPPHLPQPKLYTVHQLPTRSRFTLYQQDQTPQSLKILPASFVACSRLSCVLCVFSTPFTPCLSPLQAQQ